MAINNIDDTTRNAMVDAFTARLDSGSSNAVLQIYTAGFATLLATLAYSDPSYGAAASGTAQENTITADSSADDTGTAAVARSSTTNDGSTPVTTICQWTVGTADEDINFNSVSFVAGDNVAVTDFPLTMPSADS